MAATTGTKIVKNGLVLNIDAANVGKNAGLTSVEYLIVAGGGAGGNGGCNAGTQTAGGAGGVLIGVTTLITSNYNIIVGARGIGSGNDGANSSAFGLTAIGGGGGGRADSTCTSGSFIANGRPGGSGGSGQSYFGPTYLGGQGTEGQGNAGAIGLSYINQGNNYTTGGGGGAGGPGIPAIPGTNIPGPGGPGISSSISGTLTFYGGGGGGRGGTIAAAGIGNEIGGGGTAGGNGTDGIVIIRYPGPQRAVGGTVTQVDGNTIHTFTTVGNSTFTPLTLTNNAAFTAVPDLSTSRTLATAANGPVYNSDNGGSFVFDGVNDHIDISPIWNSFPTPNTSFTLMAFCKSSNSSVQQEIIEIGEGQAGVITGFRILFFLGKAVGQILNGTTRFNTSGVTTIPNNTYVCVCFTFNGTVSTLYLNGNLEATTSTGNWIKGTTASLGRQADNSAFLAGNVSTAQIYNRALAAQEIAENFEATRGRYGI